MSVENKFSPVLLVWLSMVSANPPDWGVIFVGFYPPMVALVMELFFMNTLPPTINQVLTVGINNLGDSTHLSFVDSANDLSTMLSAHFPFNVDVQAAFMAVSAQSRSTGVINGSRFQLHPKEGRLQRHSNPLRCDIIVTCISIVFPILGDDLAHMHTISP